MLKYIHQFVQSFLREASKSRPKSRKSSKSSVDLTKNKSTVRPEILAIDFNTEGQEAERTKEILELKRTYSLLMKKFVNPKLDLMNNTKTASDINILNLKEKQELIRSALNKILNESSEHKQLEDPSASTPETSGKHLDEEETVGWVGQRTTRQAANPMVETSSRTNNLASTMFTFPETPVEPSRNNVRQIDQILKHRYKSTNFKYLSNGTEDLIFNTAKNVVESELKDCQSLAVQDIVPGTKINQGYENVKGSTLTNKVEETGKTVVNPLKGILKGSIQPSKLDVKNHSEIAGKENKVRERKDMTDQKYNQKKNINIIRSIATADKTATAIPNSHLTKERIKNDKKVIKKVYHNKVTPKEVNKQQKTEKVVQFPFEKQTQGSKVMKAKEVKSDQKYDRKNEKSTSQNPQVVENAKEVVRDHPKNIFRLSPTVVEASKFSENKGNRPPQEVECSKLNICEEIIEKTKIVDEGNVPKTNLKIMEKEQIQEPCSNNETKTAVFDSKQQSSLENVELNEKNIETSANQVVSDKPEFGDNTYWNLLANKFQKTKDDAQKLINNLEINNWKTKNLDVTDANTKDFVGDNSSGKQNSSNLNQAKTEEISTIQTEIKSTSSEDKPFIKSDGKQYTSVKTSKMLSFKEPKVKCNKVNKSKLTESNSVETVINSTKNLTPNLQYKSIDKSLSDPSSSIKMSSKGPVFKSISSEKDLQEGFRNKKHVSKNNTDVMLLEKNPSAKIDEQQISIVDPSHQIPVKDGKIKKLLKRFEKMQKNKYRQNVGPVKRIYNKIVSDGKLTKMSLHKLHVNKDTNLIHKVRKAVRSKSNSVPTDNSLPTNPPSKGKAQSNISSVAGSVNRYEVKEKKNIVNNQDSPVSFSKVYHEPTKEIKVNRVDSDIFSNVSTAMAKHQDLVENNVLAVDESIVKATNQYPKNRKTKKITTEFDLNKARKLHSRRDFIKPAKLQMYGAKRSIYTHSNPKTIFLEKSYEFYRSENNTEPNLVSGSLIRVCGLTPNKKTFHPVTTQVRSFHTTGFKCKVKKLPKKRRTSVVSSDKTKDVKFDQKVRDQTGDNSFNTSKSTESRQEIDHLSAGKSLDKTTGKFSLKAEPSKGTFKKLMSSNDDNQNKMSKNNDCSVKDTVSNSELKSSSNGELKNTNKVFCGKVKRNESMNCISKENHLQYPTISESLQQQESSHSKSMVSKLNEDIKNKQTFQDNNVALDSPKWKSRADRLEKWKLEVGMNSKKVKTLDLDKKAKEKLEIEQCSEDRVDKESVISENNEIIDSSVCKADNNSSDKEISCLNNAGKDNMHVNNTDCVINEITNDKINNIEYNRLKSPSDALKSLLPFTTESHIGENGNENPNATDVQNESSGQIDGQKKSDASAHKIKEFESKLRILESKLKILESKSTEERKTNLKQENVSDASSSPKEEQISVNENKTDVRLKKLFRTETENKNRVKNTNSPVKQRKTSLNNDQNELSKEQLSQKVKNLELKLKNLETKLKGLKQKPTDSSNREEIHKLFSLSNLSKENINSKQIHFDKPNEKIDKLPSTNSVSNPNLIYLNKNNFKDQIKEKNGNDEVGHTQSETYIDRYLAMMKKDLKKNISSVKTQNQILLNLKHSTQSVSPPSQDTNTFKECQSKIKNEIEAKELSGNVQKQKHQPKNIRLTAIAEAKNDLAHLVTKSGIQKNDLTTKSTTQKNDLAQGVLKNAHVATKPEKPKNPLAYTTTKSAKIDSAYRTNISGMQNGNVAQVTTKPGMQKKDLAQTVAKPEMKNNDLAHITAKSGAQQKDNTKVTNKPGETAKPVMKKNTLGHIATKPCKKNVKIPYMKSNVTPITKVLKKIKSHGKNQKEDKISSNKSSQQNTGSASDTSDKVVNFKSQKRRKLQKRSSSVANQETANDLSKAALKPKKSVKGTNDNSDLDKKQSFISKKKNSKSVPSFSIDKKTTLKRNLNHHTIKGDRSLNSEILAKNRINTLHEGLVHSTKWLKPLKSQKPDMTVNVIDKVYPSSQANQSKPPVLPEKLTKPFNNTKIILGKQNLISIKDDCKRSNKSTGLKTQSPKVKNDLKFENSIKREEKNFNSFDYFKPKRRTYEVKHPIEKEKCGIEFLRKYEINVDNLYAKLPSPNSSLYPGYSQEQRKRGKDSVKFKESKHFNILLADKNPLTMKSIQK